MHDGFWARPRSTYFTHSVTKTFIGLQAIILHWSNRKLVRLDEKRNVFAVILICRSIDFPAQAKYSYFSADLRLNIFSLDNRMQSGLCRWTQRWIILLMTLMGWKPFGARLQATKHYFFQNTASPEFVIFFFGWFCLLGKEEFYTV